MARPGMQVLRVSQLTRYIRELFDLDMLLQDVWVEGEVSGYSRSTAGHIYFSLKDEASQIACVMWRSAAEGQDWLPQDGEAVLAHGRVSLYEQRGVYQLYVDLIRPAGLGLLYLEFEALKARLEGEGLFAPEHKRLLPPFPRQIGVVTSPVGAAIRDILQVLERRYPLAEVILAPTLVQGDEAPPQIAAALDALNDHTEVEVIILARGGGAPEELWAFNDEQVARAVFRSRVPVITGVGHETDFTIADFVADVRAPTPSAAAEMAVPDREELGERVRLWAGRLKQLAEERVTGLRQGLEWAARAMMRLSPQAQVETRRQRLDELTGAMTSRFAHRLALAKEKLAGQMAHLESLDPARTLARGYAVVRHIARDEVVQSVAQVLPGDAIEVQVADGSFAAEVTERGEDAN